MNDCRIRPGRAGDAAALAQIYAGTVRALGPQLYTPQQVEAWAGYGSQLDKFEAFLEVPGTFVWEEGGGIMGFCTLNADGYVNLLYVAPKATRKGIGGALLAHALNYGENELGLRRFTTKASHFSHALFARYGFLVEEEEIVDFGGADFHRYGMALEVQPRTGGSEPL